MTLNIDNFNYLFSIKNISLTGSSIHTMYNMYMLDILYTASLINNMYGTTGVGLQTITNYIAFYLDAQYSLIVLNNLGSFLYSTKVITYIKFNFLLTYLLCKFFKINLVIFVVYTIFFITNLENYIKQLKAMNSLTRLFILNATEKEVGPVDDYFFFVTLFVLTISLFIFTSIFLIILQSKIFIWAVGAFFLLTFLILSIPVNLFIDFGAIFCTAIRGSSKGNNFLQEVVFDIISTTTVFIRFVIQNIRFLFIFLGIFELLEWVFSNNSTLFVSTNYFNNNFFFINSISESFYSIKNFNYLLINSLLFILLYFYYILHLLFLLLVQISVYIGISLWLFFFLYSTKFLSKLDKLYISKNLQ